MQAESAVAARASRPRVYYGWVMVWVAAAAMVGTLPGRTQGLGLITEPLIADLRIGRVDYAQLNLWATLIGALFAIGIGRFIDRLGTRFVLTVVAFALGVVVCAMSEVDSFWALAIAVTLTRGLGQSALSVVSLAMVGQWFVRRIDLAMALYSVVMSIGFMAAFPIVGSLVQTWGWRGAWLAIGFALLGGLAPLGWMLSRRSPESMGLSTDGDVNGRPDRPDTMVEGGATVQEALATPAFWVFAIGAALYGLVASGIGLFNESILAERGFGPDVYYQTLIVTALTALVGNFGGGWLATRMPLSRLLAISLLILTAGLAALPHVATIGPRADVGHGHGTGRRPGDGVVLQRLAARLRPDPSRPHSGRGAGDDGPGLRGWTAASGVVRRVDRQLSGDVPDSGRRHRPDGRGRVNHTPSGTTARSLARSSDRSTAHQIMTSTDRSPDHHFTRSPDARFRHHYLTAHG